MSRPSKRREGEAATCLFSVIIPSYNRSATLPSTLASLLRQSLADFEAIVVDDGSNDETASVAHSVNDPRVRYVHQAHAGRSVARNLGAGVAGGSFLAFLDSDDEVDQTWLERMAEGLEQAPVACCGASIMLPKRKVVYRMPDNLGPVYYNYKGLFLAGTFALERGLFLRVGGYDAELAYSENTDLALRLTEYCHEHGVDIAVIDDPLLHFRRHRRADATETSTNARLAAARRILEKHGERYRSNSLKSYGNYHAIAGTNAARLHSYKEARQHFREAAGHHPRGMRYWFRWIVTFVPGLRSRIWRRPLPA